MKLLNEIRDEITNSNSDLSSTLRKAKILAASLKNKQFRLWLNNELSGYKEGSELPDYRIIFTQSFGFFTGPFGSSMNNVALPTANLPDFLKDVAEKIEFTNGIKQIESLVEGTEGKSLKQVWAAEAVILAREHIQMSGRLVLTDAWKHLNVSDLENVLDQVRNRLLDFLLELQEIVPDEIASNESTNFVQDEKISNVFNYTIYGNDNIVASGSGISQNVTQNITKGDFESLSNYLESIQVQKEEIEELREIIDEQNNKPSFSEKVKTWIGKMTYKAIEGIWNVGVATAPKLLESAIKYYLGLK